MIEIKNIMYADNEDLIIKVKYHDPTLPRLEKLVQGDWIDLRSRIDIHATEGKFMYIPLGVSIHLPRGYEAYVMPRSSSFKKWGFIQTNSVGLIDESYCGDDDEWMLPVYFTRESFIYKGDRICQFRIQKKMPEVVFKEVQTLSSQSRGGLGSTGTT